MRAVSMIALALAFCLPAWAQELAEAHRIKLKSVTVLVRAAQRRGAAGGSGFLFQKSGDIGFVMTCEHAVSGVEKVQVVFDVGGKDERKLTAQVVATDRERDLACLRLQAKDLPSPLELGTTTDCRTTSVYVAGFPFENMLASEEGSRKFRLTRATLSSIRYGARGEVALVKLTDDLNPGNSGGPVVDSGCKVVGVAQSKIGSSTSFAATLATAQGFLRGRPDGVEIRRRGAGPTFMSLEARVSILDPLEQLRGVSFAYVRQDALAGVPSAKADGTWDAIHPAMKEAPVEIIAGNMGIATFEVTRARSDPTCLGLRYQLRYVAADGARWTGPASLGVEFTAASTAPDPDSDGPTPAPEVPAAKGVVLETTDELEPIGKISLLSVVSELFLTRDGSALYALDLSEGKVYRIDPVAFQIVGEAVLPDGAVAMDLSPDEESLYVVIRETDWPRRDDEKGSGAVHVLNARNLAITSSFHLAAAPADVAALDHGMLFISCLERSGGLVLVDSGKKAIVGSDSIAHGGSILQLMPDQSRLYYGTLGLYPTDFHCVSVMPDPELGFVDYDSPYQGDHPLGGAFAISPDGGVLIARTGSVLCLTRTETTDMRFIGKIDPHLGIAFAGGCDTFYTTTADGFVQEHSLGSLKMKKSIRTSRVLYPVALDGKRGVLYASCSRRTAVLDRTHRGGSGRLQVGDLMAYSVKKR